jgi:transcriptional regulator with XRE-family HTH domain
MSVTQSVDELNLAVAERVRVAMSGAGLSQRAIAEQLGVSQQWVSRRIAGRVAFNLAELARVANVLDVPISDLIAA